MHTAMPPEHSLSVLQDGLACTISMSCRLPDPNSLAQPRMTSNETSLTSIVLNLRFAIPLLSIWGRKNSGLSMSTHMTMMDGCMMACDTPNAQEPEQNVTANFGATTWERVGLLTGC
jgi:hypothetical protein